MCPFPNEGLLGIRLTHGGSVFFEKVTYGELVPRPLGTVVAAGADESDFIFP